MATKRQVFWGVLIILEYVKLTNGAGSIGDVVILYILFVLFIACTTLEITFTSDKDKD